MTDDIYSKLKLKLWKSALMKNEPQLAIQSDRFVAFNPDKYDVNVYVCVLKCNAKV